LLKLEVGRPAPYYAPHLEGAPATPRLYVVGSRCPELAQQLEDAQLLPVDSGRKRAGEIVDRGREGQHGHAVAALRYDGMGAKGATRPHRRTSPMRTSTSVELMRRYDEQMARPRRSYEWT
jgi:hypothetical protein